MTVVEVVEVTGLEVMMVQMLMKVMADSWRWWWCGRWECRF